MYIMRAPSASSVELLLDRDKGDPPPASSSISLAKSPMLRLIGRGGSRRRR
jgi:hypothetical protein